MPGYYDLWTVSLSYAIAALSGFAAFESVRHARQSERRVLWTTVGGVVLGFGIWSMHFTGMLAWVPPFSLFYSAGRTAASMVAAVFASILAMRMAVAPALPSRFRLTVGAVFIGSGICEMHYIGMSAIHFSMPPMWSIPWIAASGLVALVASFAALLLLNSSDRDSFGIGQQVLGALAIGLAICGMHYSGMHGMMLHPGTTALQYPGDVTGATLARIGVGNALIFTFCLLVISYNDRLRLLRTTHDAQTSAQEAGRRAEQLSAAGRIAASLAHEVNNPLAAVTNLVYLAEKSDISPAAASYLHQAQNELRRVSEITTHTLKFYRQQHAASSASLPELAESVLLLFSEKLEALHISVQTAWEPGVPKLECLAGEIRQVIANLVENAIDAMPDGGTLSLSVCVIQNAIELAVGDTGFGIPEEVRGKLFQPFFTTKRLGGTGLGLSISTEIVERHGGKLNFETRTTPPHQGTTFKMVLPRLTDESTSLLV